MSNTKQHTCGKCGMTREEAMERVAAELAEKTHFKEHGSKIKIDEELTKGLAALVFERAMTFKDLRELAAEDPKSFHESCYYTAESLLRMQVGGYNPLVCFSPYTLRILYEGFGEGDQEPSGMALAV